jgi:hypothetical protein
MKRREFIAIAGLMRAHALATVREWKKRLELIRGLKAEAAAGFRSRRERCREPTPVTPQYAAFQTYKAARVHKFSWHGLSQHRQV